MATFEDVLERIISGIMGRIEELMELKDMTAEERVQWLKSKIEEWMGQSEVLRAMMDALKSAVTWWMPEKPPSMEEVLNEKIEFALNASRNVQNTIDKAGLVGFVPFVNASGWILNQLNIPNVRAGVEVASEFYMSPWRYGQMPLIKYYVLSKYQPLRPDEYVTARAYLKGWYTKEDYHVLMKHLGYREWAADDFWKSLLEGLPPEAVLDLLRRKAITEGDAKTILKYLSLIHISEPTRPY